MLALVALRFGVGWHFFTQGTKKLEPGFSSESFLRAAKGPLAKRYHAMLPEFHGFDAAMEELLADNQAEPKDIRQVLAAADNPLDRWADRVKQDWSRYAGEAEAHYGYQERQELRPAVDEKDRPKIKDDVSEKELAKIDERQLAADRLDTKFRQLDEAVDEFRDWLVNNPHDITHTIRLAKSKTLDEIPYERPRWSTQAAEIEGPKNKLLADVKLLEKELEADLWNVLPAERQAKLTLLEQPTSSLARFDTFLTVSLIAIGVCLMIGFLTPLAAFGGAFFLLSVIGTQPPWVMDALPVYEQINELLALLVIATTGAGRWGGLDFFLARLCGCCSTRPSKPA